MIGRTQSNAETFLQLIILTSPIYWVWKTYFFCSKSYVLPSKEKKIASKITGLWVSGWPDTIRTLLFPIFTSTNKWVTVTSFKQYHISLSQPVNQIKSCTCWLMMYELKHIPSAYLNSTCWQECPSGRVTFKKGIRTVPTKKSGLQDHINLPPEQKSLHF